MRLTLTPPYVTKPVFRKPFQNLAILLICILRKQLINHAAWLVLNTVRDVPSAGLRGTIYLVQMFSLNSEV